MSMQHASGSRWIERLARTGLTAKGIVYVVLGVLTFRAAFEIGGQPDQEANRCCVFQSILDVPAVAWLLGALVLGILCYCAWRFVQAFRRKAGGKKIKPLKRVRYGLSGLGYGGVAMSGFRMLVQHGSKGDQNQKLAGQLLDHRNGQLMAGVAALVLAGIGVYQVYYALSEKYKKHVQDMSREMTARGLLLGAGKTGYVARGLVWLILAFLFAKAALHANAGEAGDTGKAFSLVESSYGSLLLGVLGLGLVAYGVFNFIRVRYERIE
ncbi:MAG: hypothetical protein JWP27_2442 [Flaviaesturariibacter sp.]|nr:hypothetical protein [Flaviaesturariibacter sp.]